jgi:hypothetical protein
MAYKGTTFTPPRQITPGRYLVSFLIKDYPGTAGQGDAGIPENLGWIPLISTWHTTGKANIERALSDHGIYATAVAVKNMEWGPAHRGGKYDLFGLSPWVQDFSFDVVLDIQGAIEGGGLSGFRRTQENFQSQLSGLGVAVTTVILVIALILALGGVVAYAFGKGDVYITALRKIAEIAAESVASVVSGAVGGITKGLGLPIILGLGVVAAIWVMKSPKGRALKAAAWG